MLTCPVCERPLDRRPTVRPAQERGSVSALVEGLPELVCPAGHATDTVVPDAGAALQDAAAAQLVTARRTRLRRTLRCGSCDTELTIPGRRTERVVSELIPGLGVVRVVLDVPMMRCPECGVEQLPAEVGDEHLPAAIAAAADGTTRSES